MQCPFCGGHSTVDATRAGADLTTQRRRRCAVCNKTFTTIEVHREVFCSAKPRSKAFAATVRARIARRQRDMIIAARLGPDGWMELARRFALTKAAVYIAASRGREFAKQRNTP